MREYVVWSQTFPSNNKNMRREGEEEGGGGRAWANGLPFGVVREFHFILMHG